MRPTQYLLGGGGGAPIGTHGKYLGDWGNFGGMKQKGIISYGIAPNRHAQVLYWAPPMIAGYYIVNWAVERNHYLNSKQGRAEFGGQEE
ncbi:cytochrome b-c1 complex subunit 8 [Chaetomium fimeti]|uniref:Cytochrome b-c1 complex subunit 8 n=1 Tax=Chaetomium fimeti TaxID=1854472 RepID=A0AAE0HI95_9PEZI|nr:cytochrome b-c1 complex subunit 8 [Chaetomium fimeti]